MGSPSPSYKPLVRVTELPQENFDACDQVPGQWLADRRAQFSNLSGRARDILSMPGNINFLHHCLPFLFSLGSAAAVTVERIFSGEGHDISPRCANLKPDTIRFIRSS
jgi:hypothetical protein